MDAPGGDLQAIDALIAEAGALMRAGRREAALALFEDATRTHPTLPSVWINRGTVLHTMGRHADALASFD